MNLSDDMNPKFIEAKIAYDNDDYLKAIPLLIELADNVPVACMYLGCIYKWGNEDVEVDDQKSLTWYSKYIFLLDKFSKANDLDSKFQLARCFQYGTYVSCDEERAVELYKNCAGQGHLEAQFHLSCLWEYGWCGLEKNPEKRMHWLQKAAEAEFPEALYVLGLVYLENQKENLGLKLIEKSATLNFWPAEDFLKSRL